MDAFGSSKGAKLKKLSPIYSADEYWVSKLGISSDHDIINFLKQNLPQKVLHMFSNTIFGNFLEIPCLRVSKQLIHSLIMRELSQTHTDSIYIGIGGKIMYFGIEHFLLISGLKPTANDKFQPTQTGVSTKFCRKYFGKKTNTKKADIENLLKKPNHFSSDEDCLKMALVYFIGFYLMGTDPNVRVPSMYFDCVENNEYEKVAWGDLSFRATINGLKKNGRGKKRPGSYRVEGCPLIYQLWFYEVCGACEGLICKANRMGRTYFYPRMFHWKASLSDFHKSTLESEIFNKNAKDLDLKKIEATDQEIEILSLEQYFPPRDPLQLNHQDIYDNGKDDESPSTSKSEINGQDDVLKTIASFGVHMQQGLHVTNKKIDKLYKRLSDFEKTVKKYCTMKDVLGRPDREYMGEEIDNDSGLKDGFGQISFSFDHENNEKDEVVYSPCKKIKMCRLLKS